MSILNSELSLPVVAAPMFLISGPELVVACCDAGVVGTFPALNQRSTEGFSEWLTQIEETKKTKTPYGVNLIVHRSNPRVQADLQVCVKHKVPLVITSLGAVSEVVQAVHSYGGLVYHDVTNRRHAEKAMEAGVDGVICVAAGAGGHAGTVNPFALVGEVRSFFDGTVLLAGGISSGADVAAALAAGADLAYVGTRFINASESRAPEDYRNMIEVSGTKDVIYTAAISGIPGNFLRPSLEACGLTSEHWERKVKVDLAKELDAASAEAKAWKTVWSAGHGVATISDTLPTAELVARMKKEFHARLGELDKVRKKY